MHADPLFIKVLVLGNRRATLLVVSIRVVGVETIAGLAHPLRGPTGRGHDSVQVVMQ